MTSERLTANEARAIAHHLAARTIDAETGTYPIRPEDAPNVDEASWNAIDICLGRRANSLRLGGGGYPAHGGVVRSDGIRQGHARGRG